MKSVYMKSLRKSLQFYVLVFEFGLILGSLKIKGGGRVGLEYNRKRAKVWKHGVFLCRSVREFDGFSSMTGQGSEFERGWRSGTASPWCVRTDNNGGGVVRTMKWKSGLGESLMEF